MKKCSSFVSLLGVLLALDAGLGGGFEGGVFGLQKQVLLLFPQELQSTDCRIANSFAEINGAFIAELVGEQAED